MLCSFEMQVETRWGDTVMLVGSVPQLGSWVPSRGMAMTTSSTSYPVWAANLLLTERSEGELIEYKIIVRRADGSIVWENLDNRPLVHTYGREVCVRAAWNDARAVVTVLREPPAAPNIAQSAPPSVRLSRREAAAEPMQVVGSAPVFPVAPVAPAAPVDVMDASPAFHQLAPSAASRSALPPPPPAVAPPPPAPAIACPWEGRQPAPSNSFSLQSPRGKLQHAAFDETRGKCQRSPTRIPRLSPGSDSRSVPALIDANATAVATAELQPSEGSVRLRIPSLAARKLLPNVPPAPSTPFAFFGHDNSANVDYSSQSWNTFAEAQQAALEVTRGPQRLWESNPRPRAHASLAAATPLALQLLP